jgi:hypothetical protein
MVMAGPGSPWTVERPGTVGALLLPESKLGRLTTVVLPPRMSTPGAAEIPVGAEPAPPGPGVGEVPVRALGSEPRPEPDFPAPVASGVVLPARPLPGPVPAPIPAPPPEPPRPGLSPPEGDRESDPLPPVPGMPGLEPGSADKTTPELSVVPFAALGGARAEPMSPGAPSPKPFLPEPEPTELELGGGGIMLLARRPPLAEPLELLEPVPEVEPGLTDGGGGTTLGEFGFDEFREEPGKLLEEPFAPEVACDPATDGGGGITLEEDGNLSEDEPPGFELEFPTEGGGGMTLVARDVPDPPALREVPAALEEVTLGGGGTTSCVPKSLPMMLLTNDPLAA